MESRRIAAALLVLRLTIFFVMLIWTIDKFVRPAHAGMLGACFTLYYLRDLDTLWSVRGKKG